ncbi:MAG: hypothetical protein F7C81_04590 [Desulfurococcales archaeon]|nr:hypothetical protein [Desulfurococcales archaeon]
MPGFVARVGGCGSWLRPTGGERECCVEIAWLAVERSFHGKRIGSLLLGAAGAYACGGGKPMFTVKTYGGWITSPTMKP